MGAVSSASDGVTERDGVPATFEAYARAVDDGGDAADGGDARFTDWLRARSEPTWTDAVTHPFTRDLGSGELPEDVYAEYLVQDYAFVDELVGAFGHAVGQAPEMDAKRPLVEFLDTLTDEENDYFERSFDALDVSEDRRHDPELSDPIAALIDLLGRATHVGGYAETLAVLVPAEWIYESWATAVVDEYADAEAAKAAGADSPPSAGTNLPFYYAEWIDLHAIPAFREFVDWLRSELDAIGPTLSPRRQARVEQLFRRTVDLEVAVFESVTP